MVSKKKAYNITSNYGIYTSKNFLIPENQIAQLSSNFLGTQFYIFENGKSSKKANSI